MSSDKTSDSGEGLPVSVTECDRCPRLTDCRSQIVNGVGPVDADILLVGEAPGQKEDSGGEPFVGRSGSILDEALDEAHLSREDIRITNCVRCRPPENKDPWKSELANCEDHLWSEIVRVDPDVIVPLGRIPCEQVLGDDVKISDDVGSIHEIDRWVGSYTVVLSVHPAATLYNRSLRPDFDAVFEAVSELA